MFAAKLSSLDPSRFYLLVLGAGNAFTRTRYNSSFLLVGGGRTVLVDCPSPLRRILFEAGRRSYLDVDIFDIDDVVITHLHGDHCNGLEELGFFKRYAQQIRPPHIYTLPELVGPMWENRLKAAMGFASPIDSSIMEDQVLADFFDVNPWDTGEPNRLAGAESPFTFEIRRTDHLIPTFGFRVTFHAGPRPITLGYSSDTAWDPRLIDFLAPSDLMIHEVGFGMGHTPYEHLDALPPAIKSKLILTHLSDAFDVAGSSLPVLQEGGLYEIGTGATRPLSSSDLMSEINA